MEKDNKATHYIGKSGKLYSREEYINHGLGVNVIYKGYKDLPKDDYPYTFKLEFEENENKKYITKPLTGEHIFETCGSIDKPHMNGIKVQGTFEEAKTKLEELRKEDNTIGLKLI